MRYRFLSLAAALFLSAPTLALAVGDVDLIRSYVGTYTGRGVALYETGSYDEVACQISLEPGVAGKVSIQNSECNVAGTRMRFTGTMAAINGQFEAAVSSNVGFNGRTVGNREGDAIYFLIEDGQLVDRSLGLSARFIMAGGAIVIDMNLVSNATGAVTQVRVPLERR